MDFGRMAIRFVLLMAVLFWAGQALAADTPAKAPAATAAPVAAAEPHWHTMDFMDAFHHPFDGLEMGLDIRLREVYAHNLLSPDDQFGDNALALLTPNNSNDHHWQRYRTRWSTIWTLSPDVTFNTRLVWEFWSITDPERHHIPGLKLLTKQDTDFREMIFDTMNIKWKNAFDAPMTLTVGRQDIILGTGWLVLDGTPGDGSRTIFFDAVRATIDLRDTTQLDLIGICQYDDERGWLTPINHREYIHLTQRTDETGFIAYVTDKSIENTQLEGYYIYKSEEPSKWTKFSKSWWATARGLDAEIHTFGGRVAQKLDDNWSYSVEVAKQFGKRDEESMTGLGSNNSLKYAFNDELKNELTLMYEYLSGDNRNTTQSERFDTLWGDWPQYQRGGDLQSYIWRFEGELGEVANLHRTGIKHSFKPGKNWTMDTLYNLMWADQNEQPQFSAAADTPIYSANSYFRGQMITGLLTYKCCKNFKTEFLVDYFIPGSYYDQSNRDHAVFARVNVEWTF
ncbi:MAG: hypothetical protein FJ263_02495 [Planctomycetes bacterium]|nr:hypothetical protein [Planctomycetota bacterium]